MITIGFTGSREWRKLGVDPKQPHRLIQNILTKLPQRYGENINIVVGDADGVDSMVLTEAVDRFPIIVYGINGVWRNRTQITHSQMVSFNGSCETYLERDRLMVDNIDVLYAVWNGESRGTKYTYDYAIKTGKRAFIATLSQQDWSWK